MENKETVFTEEMIQKARNCESAEQILALAKENGQEITEEQAAEYFQMLNPKNGELADEELDNVSGGCSVTVGDKEYTVVTSGTSCFNPYYYQEYDSDHSALRDVLYRTLWKGMSGGTYKCGSCTRLDFTSTYTGYCSVSGR